MTKIIDNTPADDKNFMSIQVKTLQQELERMERKNLDLQYKLDLSRAQVKIQQEYIEEYRELIKETK
jgi:hypothetical protein